MVTSKIVVTSPEILGYLERNVRPDTEVTYLSGRMSGMPEWNFPEFYRMEEMLVSQGLSVINPARADEELGMPDDPASARIEFMYRDVAFLFHCDSITQMMDWEKSRGAVFEAIVAYEFGLLFRDHNGQENTPVNPLEHIRAELERIRGDRDDWKTAYELARHPFREL